MSEQNDSGRSLVPSKQDPGFIRNLTDQFRLLLRLMGDSRVSPLLKVLPIGTLVYLVSPFDFPTPIDDFAVIGVGIYSFIEMCPPDVVEEHRAALRGETIEASPASPDDIVEGEFSEAAPKES
ncbi:MAG: hypothetical protein DWQ07_20840 [Chloroflexi bacterium]|nr:MAG: hypothetical protein DWQ07_20840 [Chloroflexota bacterium]MBL1194532.1 hypothetical protein [Chloroflexota bacterium]NOH11820.1 hypothetical protein [Chloroflexota bacterium]